MLCGSESLAFLSIGKRRLVPSLPVPPRDTRPDIIHTQSNTATPQCIHIHIYSIQMPVHAHTRAHISQQKELLSGKLGQTVLAGENVCAQRANLTVWHPTKRTGRLACALEWLHTHVRIIK